MRFGSRLLTRLPERSLAISLALRGAGLWLALRIVFMFVSGGIAGPRPGALALSIPAAFWLVGLTGALALADTRRRNQDRFLANLGVSEAVIVVVSMLPAAVPETLIGLASLQ